MVTLPSEICPIYKEAVEKLFEDVNAPEATFETKSELISEFSQKYLLFPGFLQHGTEKSDDERIEEFRQKIMEETQWHFYIRGVPCYEKHIKWDDNLSIHFPDKNPLDDYQRTLEQSEALFQFPHQKLEEIWKIGDYYGARPFSKKAKKDYEKSLMLYQKFVVAGDDNEKWMECLTELDNYDAILANIELRLGENQNWANQKLWKFYIEFSKQSKNYKALFQVFRRYCRLFVSDLDGRQDYLQTIADLAKTGESCAEYWADIVKIYADFESLKAGHGLLSQISVAMGGPPLNMQISLEEKLKIFESSLRNFELCRYGFLKYPEVSATEKPSFFTRYAPVTFMAPPPVSTVVFPFPYFIKTRIFENLTPKMIFKLHKCCKFFVIKFPHPICHRLVFDVDKNLQYVGQSVFLNFGNIHEYPDKFLHITNNLTVPYVKNRRDVLSLVIPKIYKCDAQVLHISHQDITVSKFKILIESGNVKVLTLFGSHIFKDQDPLKEKNRVYSTKEEIKAMLEENNNVNLETFVF